MVLEAHSAFTPAGKPVTTPIPVAPVVVCVILASTLFTHIVGVEEAGETMFLGVTVITPVAFSLPQPPVKGIT